MKRQWIIAGVVSLLLIVGGFVVAQCLWWLPLDRCSEVYRRYADSRDIAAAYIKDYKVNDTLTLSATVLQALNDTGWNQLYDDFHLTLRKREIKTNTLENGDDILEIVHVGDSYDAAVASHRGNYICVFHVKYERIKTEIHHAIIDRMFNSLSNHQNFNTL